MVGQHDFQQLPVKALRATFDLAEIEARLEIEIVGAGAVLEIEVDQAGQRLASLTLVKQHHRGLDRERRHTRAADGGQEGVDFRLFRFGCGRSLGDPRASSHQFHRRHRLHHEIGHAHLHHCAGDTFVERLGHDDDRRPGAGPRHETLESFHFVGSRRVEIDDRDGRLGKIQRFLGLVDRPLDQRERDLRARPESEARLLRKAGIRRQHDDVGLAWRIVSAQSHRSHSPCASAQGPLTGAAGAFDVACDVAACCAAACCWACW
jgi:hypothetical protein